MSLAPPPKEAFSLAPEPTKDPATDSFGSSFGMSFGQQISEGTKPAVFPSIDQATIPDDGEYEDSCGTLRSHCLVRSVHLLPLL
jgi:hypothetical protein